MKRNYTAEVCESLFARQNERDADVVRAGERLREEDMGANSCSREPSPRGLGPSGFDQGRVPDYSGMEPRKNPHQPIFRDHDCWKCRDGELPCVLKGGHSLLCEYPHARND
jgi:hypothetical protein